MKIEHFIRENKSFIFLQKGENGLICSDFSTETSSDFLTRTIQPTSKAPWSSGNLVLTPYFYDSNDFNASQLKNYRIHQWQNCSTSVADFDESVSLNFAGSLLDYQKSIEECVERIKCGDFYQANLLRFFGLQSTKDIRYHLLALLQAHKPAMALWIQTKEFSLFSLSPESFIKITHLPTGESRIQSFPIKGTLKIDQRPLEELQKKIELDTKEVSELNMIIDLVRDDFHKVCQTGSVKVPASGKFLTIGNLLHRYAEVTGTLKPNISILQLFKSILPAASVTGCPKYSANLFIQKHEKTPRDFFMGNAFYFDDSGSVDSSVLIRTLSQTKNQWSGAAGSGIVIPGIPKKEASETQAKAAIFTTLPPIKP